ncbi:MAG: NADH-quinone oxidoreductase subunit J [Bacteriovoracaceae bacterium]|nr:NADH-quinone oxidoreductase subunit J [Bacteriovoracaceae bacterium]
MVNIIYPMAALCLICAALAVVMLFSKDALTCAMSLLGVLLGTAGIYGMIGAHFVATVQLVVYAGAIMVLFIFSIMLLNLKKFGKDFHVLSPKFLLASLSALSLVGIGSWAIMQWSPTERAQWSNEAMLAAGGNTKVLAHSLFTQHGIAFEAVSIALIVALIGAVTLAKRKF